MQKKSFVNARIELEKKFFPDGATPDMILLLDTVERMLGQAYQSGVNAVSACSNEQWSNNACLGYAIMGANKLGYTEKQTQDLVRVIYSEFDFKSVEEAKTTYEQSSY